MHGVLHINLSVYSLFPLRWQSPTRGDWHVRSQAAWQAAYGTAPAVTDQLLLRVDLDNWFVAEYHLNYVLAVFPAVALIVNITNVTD
jgi:hypothetical protein